MTPDDEVLTFEINADTTRLQSALLDADRSSKQFARSLGSAFDDLVVRGRKLDDVVKGVALSLSRSALKSALKPLEQAFGAGASGLFSGIAGFARGGVPGRQMPVPFATGGVVSAPTSFSFGNGQRGVMGESGAEAILPLARGSDGRLGVRSPGGGSTAGGVNVTFNVSATDAGSFQRSEAQIGMMLSRVIARGERNL